MRWSYYRPTKNPFCCPANSGPPLLLTLLLGALVIVGGIGGVTRYATREKPKLEPKLTTQPAVSKSPPKSYTPAPLPRIEPQPQNEPKDSVPPPTPLRFDEAMKGVQADESFKRAAGPIWDRSPKGRSADELRVLVARWGGMNRVSQEELLDIIEVVETKSRKLTKRERNILGDFAGEDYFVNRP